jgi:uncharacterized lipoprotein YmbA
VNMPSMPFVDSLRPALVALSLLGLMACASAPPETTYYLLRPPMKNASGPVDARLRVELGRVTVAPYLNRSSGIQIQTRAGEIQSAAHHLWAEELTAGSRWYLSAVVAERLEQSDGGTAEGPDGNFTVDVFVEQLHATMSGEAILVAAFVLRDRKDGASTGSAYEYHFSESKPLPDEGYAAVVDTEKTLLDAFAQQIVSAVREKTGAPPGN